MKSVSKKEVKPLKKDTTHIKYYLKNRRKNLKSHTVQISLTYKNNTKKT